MSRQSRNVSKVGQSFDCRKFKENEDYHQKNEHRSDHKEIDSIYTSCYDEDNENLWSGNKKKEFKAGLLQMKLESGWSEAEMIALEAKASYSNQEYLKAARADISTVKARTRYSMIELDASGPNAAAEGSVGKNTGGFVRAEIGSVGGNVGPIGARVGIGFDTGARIGVNGAEVKYLGTGVMLDLHEGIGVSFVGNSFVFKPW